MDDFDHDRDFVEAYFYFPIRSQIKSLYGYVNAFIARMLSKTIIRNGASTQIEILLFLAIVETTPKQLQV